MPEDYLPTYQPYLSSIQFICQNTHTEGSTIWPHLCVFQRGTWIIGVMEFFWLSWEKKCERGGGSCCAPPLFEEPKPLPTDIKILLGSWDGLYKAQLGIRICSSIVIVYMYNHEVIVEQIISPSLPLYHESRELPTIH